MLLMDCCSDDGGALVCISGTKAIDTRGDAANRFHTDHSSLCLPSSSEAASSSRHCILHALTVLSNSLFAVTRLRFASAIRTGVDLLCGL